MQQQRQWQWQPLTSGPRCDQGLGPCIRLLLQVASHLCACDVPARCGLAGLRQSLATAGALIGSTVASAVFISTGKSYVATFTAAIIPPAIALLWLSVVRWRGPA